MTTIGEALALAASKIDSDTSALDADLLLAHVLEKTPVFLRTWSDKELTLDQLSAFEELVIARAQGMPVAYLLGSQGFWDLELSVNSSTLIPRPDTELLVELILEQFGSSPRLCMDLGTGTGAIALAIAKHRPDWFVVGCDRVYDAACLAVKNAALNNVPNAGFMVGNWIDAIAESSVDVLVSNPPYIEDSDPHLAQGDVRFEPASALVSGEDGLDDIRKIVSSAGRVLKRGGSLFFEHGYQQADVVQAIFAAHDFIEIGSYKDLAGHYRVTKARKVD